MIAFDELLRQMKGLDRRDLRVHHFGVLSDLVELLQTLVENLDALPFDLLHALRFAAQLLL